MSTFKGMNVKFRIMIMIQISIDTKSFFILGYRYDESSVERAKQFLSNCRSSLESDSNLFWVAFQSNLLVDVQNVDDSFPKAFKAAKEEL